MTIYYLVIPKNDANTSGKNLSLATFGEHEVSEENMSSLLLDKKTGNQQPFAIYNKVPTSSINQKEFTDTHHVLKVEFEQDKNGRLFFDRVNCKTKYLNNDLTEIQIHLNKAHLITNGPLKMKIVSQIMPNGNEMSKQDVMRSIEKEVAAKIAMEDKKPKQNPVAKAASFIGTAIAQKVINIKERNVGKENVETPRRKM